MVSMKEIKLGKYKHFKSDEKVYEVLGKVWDTELDEWVVLYKALYDIPELGGEGILFTRSVDAFFGKVKVDGKMVKRFSKID